MKAPTTSQFAVIEPARITQITITIEGTAPYVQHKFGQKSKLKMMADMATPAAEKKGRKVRPPRDYGDDFQQATHFSTAGWVGIPCSAFRSAMIDACRTVGIVMTKAKMAVFVQPDGFDADDGTPLVKLISDEPEVTELPVRNDNGGTDIRVRPMWREWMAEVTMAFDEDMINASSVVNLLDRAGRQVGIGEGRPYSKNSTGMGWGTFRVLVDNAE